MPEEVFGSWVFNPNNGELPRCYIPVERCHIIDRTYSSWKYKVENGSVDGLPEPHAVEKRTPSSFAERAAVVV